MKKNLIALPGRDMICQERFIRIGEVRVDCEMTHGYSGEKEGGAKKEGRGKGE